MTPIRNSLPDPGAVDPLEDTQQMDRSEVPSLTESRPVGTGVSPLAKTLQLTPSPPPASIAAAHAAPEAIRPAVPGDDELSEVAGRAEALGVIVRRIHLIGG